ncbi:MAG: MBL fold metallo-hydrolase [Eubacterium sp.]|nr:MBL fold metallo-hydrolase [Eubacterium sp.]
MTEMMPIASGSSGNCIYVGTDDTHVLIDAGISGKRVEQGLNGAGLSMSDIDAVLVTHEHIDHVKGLGVLARRWEKPIYATGATIDAIKENTSLGKIDSELFCPIDNEGEFTIGDLEFNSFPISHDAADPVAYIARNGSKSVGVVTDLGVYDESTVERLKGLDILLLEANHDVRMLEIGRYPYHLKMRIMGERGHLSNETAGKLLSEALHDDIKTIVLGHLSRENNLPQLALESVKAEITLSETPYKGNDFKIIVAGRDEPTEKLHA